MDSKHDPTFMSILREEKNISNFVDSFFGFLYRCTDFYIESTPSSQFGLPPGLAEELVRDLFRKWQSLKKLEQCSMNNKAPPSVAREVTIANNGANEIEKTKDSPKKNIIKPKPKSSSDDKTIKNISSDCYNGASYDNYKWSQTITDLDVVILLPEEIAIIQDVRVVLNVESIEVAVLQKNGSWKNLLQGRFAFKIKNSESYWCLEPGKHISIHLEKSSERWWEQLLDSEPKIDLRKIDCSRNFDEMPDADQMKVEELMWNQRRKLLGQSTSEKMRMEKILQQAWNADGSPFKGTEYDPSVVKFN